jgi:hypothetical protein
MTTTLRPLSADVKPTPLSLPTIRHLLGCQPLAGQMSRDWYCCYLFLSSQRCNRQLANMLADLCKAFSLVGMEHAVMLRADVAELAGAIRGLRKAPAAGATNAVEAFWQTIDRICNNALVEVANLAGCQDVVTGNPH